MKLKAKIVSIGMASILVGFAIHPTTSNAQQSIKLEIAQFEDDNRLIWPANFESWVFLGTTMGMTYFDEEPDPADPGLMSSVFIEPEAYQYFETHGEFADGTMFVKSVKQTLSEGGGFFMGEELGIEVHVKDRERFPKHGYNFYFFPAGSETAAAMPEDNICVSCHQENAAFDNVFIQFYPSIRRKLDGRKAAAD